MTFIRSIHPDLSQTESQIERIASKTPVIQIVIVTLHPQMTSALCLCRFQQPQALRSFPLRYLSNAYDRVTSSFSEGYLLIIFSRTYWNTLGRWSEYVPNLLEYVGEVVAIRSEVVGIRSEPTIPLKSRSHDVKVSGLIVRRKGVDMLPVASSVKGRKVRIRARVRLPNRYPVWW